MCKIKFYLKETLIVLFQGEIFLKIRWCDEWDFRIRQHDQETIVHRKFEETLITDNWNDCVKNDIGMCVVTGKAKTLDRITNVILFFYTLSIVTYCLEVFIANADVTDKTIEISLINKLEFPFNINTQRMYRCVLMMEFTDLILCNWVDGIVNAILSAMVSYCANNHN